MKTAIKYIVVLSFIGIGIGLAAYTYKTPITNETSLLTDFTDQDISQPSEQDIFGFYRLSGNNKWNGAIFRASNLTDVSYTPVREYKLEPANKWLSNELSRAQEIRVFQTDISGYISSEEKVPVGKLHSSLYVPMVNELIVLSQSRAQLRNLVVSSDLMENDPDLSFYNEKVFALIRSNPDSIRNLLNSREHLPNLSGIAIYFVFQPANPTQDIQYRIVSQFYRNLLQDKGATVYIKANLSN